MKVNEPAENKKVEPTKSELEILQILWQHGPSTVRFVMEELNKIRELNYTATLKLMQLMTDKGILQRDQSQMTHIYRALVKEQPTKEHLLGRFVDTVYQGATDKIMMQLLGSKNASAEDIAAIQAILDKLDKNK